MTRATVFVLLPTAFAPTLGPELTGSLAPFPLYAVVLAIFAHRLEGPVPAARVLHGRLLGLRSFTPFFLVLAAKIERVDVATAFSLAFVAAPAAQAGSLWTMGSRLPSVKRWDAGRKVGS
jgi:hypothetical protein